jgi:NAD(P)-dependent dehydrogenase (short-subunit alcohol dehydrogenase family)
VSDLFRTMGIVMQPKVYPLPTGIDLKGKTVIITGSSAGMGLESARQLLALNASTVILAVRNTSKGETCRKELLADSAVKAHNPSAVVKVMKVDMDSYDSIQKFAKAVKAEVPILNLLVLNAGIGLLKLERSAAGHERTLQVNYLSNVLLTLELLPHLEASAEKSGSQSRITWVGSRTHYNSTFAKKAPIQANEGVISHMDNEKFFFPFQKYNDTKLLCVMFMYDLAPRVNKDKVLINMLCPGMVDTNMSDVLPIYLRIPINIVKAIRARPVEQGGWLILHSAVVAGTDSHGEFLLDKDIQP